MFIPLYDTNRLRHIRFQYVTLALIIVNVLTFVFTVLGVSEEIAWAGTLGLGYIPAVMNNLAELSPERIIVPENLTYLTYAFVHADAFHLGGNMVFLWVFGDNVEDALGHLRYLLFYLLCAAAGAFLHGVILADSELPLIGASGAVAGVVSAYLILHPRVKIWILVAMRIPLRIPAWIPLVLWIAVQFFMLSTQTEDEISWPAHVGGIIAGAVLVVFMRRKGVALFDRNLDVAVTASTQTRAVNAPNTPEKAAAPAKWGRQA